MLISRFHTPHFEGFKKEEKVLVKHILLQHSISSKAFLKGLLSDVFQRSKN